MKTTFSQL